ncbi:hypothetical protein BDZ45DRAFT_730406 [Acephala macrosclerotiorum]|nr:hypothetical protein BDZ45DRAFT_730406 [Acephala macrosclerotiorum]
MADSDGWPTFDIEEATVSIPGQESVVDILEIVAKKRLSTVLVRGLIDQSHRLNLTQKTEILEPIELRKVIYYSIGFRPVALWIGQNSTWYSIFPDGAQDELWKSQCHAIGIFFAAVDYYDDDSARLGFPMLDQVTQILAKHGSQINGSGCTFGDLIQACRDNYLFLEFHMRDTAPSQQSSDGTPYNFPDTKFYEWIAGGCALEALMNGTVNFSELQDCTEIASDDEEEEEEEVDGEGDIVMVDDGIEEETTPVPGSSAPKGKKKNWPPWKGEYISPQRPAGTPMPETFVDVALALIYHFVHSGRENITLETLTLGTINTALYKDFNFKMPQVASHMMSHNAKTIYALLPPNFKKATIGKDLLAQVPMKGSIKCTKDHDTKKSNDQWEGLKAGTEILKQRGSGRPSGAAASPSVGAATPAASRTGRVSRVVEELSAGAATPPPDSASGSGSVNGNDAGGGDKPGFINGKPIPTPIKRSGVTWFGTAGNFYSG